MSLSLVVDDEDIGLNFDELFLTCRLFRHKITPPLVIRLVFDDGDSVLTS